MLKSLQIIAIFLQCSPKGHEETLRPSCPWLAPAAHQNLVLETKNDSSSSFHLSLRLTENRRHMGTYPYESTRVRLTRQKLDAREGEGVSRVSPLWQREKCTSSTETVYKPAGLHERQHERQIGRRRKTHPSTGSANDEASPCFGRQASQATTCHPQCHLCYSE